MANVDEYIEEQSKGYDTPDTPSPEARADNEAKRESLAILASLGTTKEYLGVEMTLGNITKLSPKEVEKYFTRYQVVLGKQVTGSLVDSALNATSKVLSYALPIDDHEALSTDLQKDELVRRELANLAGLLVLRGGRMVALASGLIQVAKHIKLDKSKEIPGTTQESPQEELSTPEVS